MASQLILTYNTGRITEDQLEIKPTRTQWVIKSRIAFERENDLTVFELQRKTRGVLGNPELIKKIENVILEHFNQK